MSDKVTITLSLPEGEIKFSCWPNDSFSIVRRRERVEVWLKGIRVAEHIIGGANEPSA